MSARPTRRAIEAAIVSDVQAVSAESDHLGRAFCARNQLNLNDFRALLHVIVAERDRTPLTQSQLGGQIGVSGAAITYLVDRMVESGHLSREPHPVDRRKTLLRHAENGSAVARSFFAPLGERTTAALADFSIADLTTTHRVLDAVVEAMREFNDDMRGAPPS